MTNYTYLGWGTTDSNGVAKLEYDANDDPLSHSYTGVGAGEVDVVASLDKPIVSGSVVSGTYPVIDALYYDPMTSDTTSNYAKGNCTLVLDTDKFVLTRSADGQCLIDYDVPSASLSQYLGKTLTFELDIKSADTGFYLEIYYNTGSWQRKTGTAQTTGTLTVTQEVTTASALKFRVNANYLGTNGSVSFNNLRIYVS